MLTYRRKGVIRILFGVMSKEHFPLTTDAVFNRVGYDLTFTLEEAEFEPASPPIQPVYEKNDDEAGSDQSNDDQGPDNVNKKQKNENNASASSSQMQGGPVP